MQLRTHFAETFGRAPEGVWSAPGRVNLIGEHTDYNDGLALPIALPQRTYAAAARRDDDRLRVRSVQTVEVVEVALDDIGPGTPGGWAAYAAGVPWALREAGYAVGGADVILDGRVPLGSGLSSSAALECAVGAALSDLYGLGLLADDANRRRLVEVCRRAENDIAGAPTGGMDQSASLLATAGHALLLDCRDGTTEQVPFPIDEAELTLLVIDTRAEHALVDGQYAARRTSCERAAAALGVPSLREIEPADLTTAATRLGAEGHVEGESSEVLARRVRHVVTEIARVREAVAAMRAGDWAELGRLFTASHASLRSDFEVSCPELDLVTAAAESAGALGARMTGGGFGGSAIALVPKELVERVTELLKRLAIDAGFPEPATFAVYPGPGAGRDD